MANRVYAGFSTAHTVPTAVRLIDQREHLVVAHQPVFVSQPDFNQFLQQRLWPNAAVFESMKKKKRSFGPEPVPNAYML